MGEPIKVGTHFGDFYTWATKIRGSYEREGDVDSRISNMPSDRSVVQMNQGSGNLAHGFCLGERAELYVNWYNGTESFYTNEYKPPYKRQVEYQKEGNQAFTTIYDWGYDSQNKCSYYYKAEDKNGNGVVDEGEITKYDNMKDLFSNGF